MTVAVRRHDQQQPTLARLLLLHTTRTILHPSIHPSTHTLTQQDELLLINAHLVGNLANLPKSIAPLPPSLHSPIPISHSHAQPAFPLLTATATNTTSTPSPSFGCCFSSSAVLEQPRYLSAPNHHPRYPLPTSCTYRHSPLSHPHPHHHPPSPSHPLPAVPFLFATTP